MEIIWNFFASVYSSNKKKPQSCSTYFQPGESHVSKFLQKLCQGKGIQVQNNMSKMANRAHTMQAYSAHTHAVCSRPVSSRAAGIFPRHQPEYISEEDLGKQIPMVLTDL